ncbi:single-stranded DNA binding protein [Coprinopsis cinerea AmutBmut pab1-1]|nr:single-stranded DNA binding protein [Coprinopsis cinerea AmutBmut pab1-1]
MSSSSEASSSSVRDSSSPEPTTKKDLKRKRSKDVSKNPKPADSDSDSSSDSSSASDSDDSERENDMDVDGDQQPVLSHAERRRQKKREKKALDDSAVPKKKLKGKDGVAIPSKESTALPKRQNSVWVGNLSFKTTQDNLRSFFKDVGEITRIHMPMKASSRPNLPQENRGFAYVDFATPEAKTAAIALSEQPLIGRKLLIKDGDDFAGRPIAPGVDVKTNDPTLAQKTHSKTAQKILRNQKQPPAPTLFLGNLPFETTEDDIREMFEAQRYPKKQSKKPKKGGKGDEDGDEEAKEGGGDDAAQSNKDSQKGEYILKVRMGTFEDTGACKGFAFVDFSSIDNATSALINPKNHHFNGRDLKVEYAGADAVRRGAAKHLLPGIAAASKDKSTRMSNGKKGEAGGNAKRGGPKSSSRSNGVEGDGGWGEGGGEQGGRDSNDKSRSRSRNGGAASFDSGAGDEREGGERGGDGGRERGSGGGRKFGGDRKQGQREFKGSKARPKPGAALAQAKRETAAIIPSQGKKITF